MTRSKQIRSLPHTFASVVGRMLMMLLFTVFPSVRADSAPLVVNIDGSVLHVAGITPGGKVAVIAALVEPQKGVYSRFSRVEQLLSDSDGDGIVSYDLGRPIPVRSIWGVVDVASGTYTVATPLGYPRREVAFPMQAVKNLPADDIDEIEHHHLLLQILWVRPGVAGWLVTTADGGANDADGKNNGRTTTPSSRFIALGSDERPPKKLKNDDVLIFIDPFEMTFSSTKVAR
jgi:hypothetical protein